MHFSPTTTSTTAHPHNLAIMGSVPGAEAVCGAGTKLVGINFVVSCRIKQ